jgi:hypothetical protein
VQFTRLVVHKVLHPAAQTRLAIDEAISLFRFSEVDLQLGNETMAQSACHRRLDRDAVEGCRC